MTLSLQDLKKQILSGSRSYTLLEAKAYVSDVLAFESKEPDAAFHKRFFHEFVPLVTIAGHVGDAGITISFGGAGHGIDGCIAFADGRKDQRIELTAATDGQNEALRDELLAVRGYAPASGKIEYTGNKNWGDRRFGPNETKWRRSDLQAQEVFALVAKALDAKKKKALSRPHYNDAWLGISIENYPPTAERKKCFYDPLSIQLLSDKAAYQPFSRVFVVSTVGDYLFDSASFTSAE